MVKVDCQGKAIVVLEAFEALVDKEHLKTIKLMKVIEKNHLKNSVKQVTFLNPNLNICRDSLNLIGIIENNIMIQVGTSEVLMEKPSSKKYVPMAFNESCTEEAERDIVTTTQRQCDSGTQGAALTVEMGSGDLVLGDAGDACVREGKGRDLFASGWLRVLAVGFYSRQ
ncbi:hypothetical protein E2542_SST16846 [Spatholobus suberectus]|nr:hypothetical protein E2542_SST16846 [Spatholobus suberectus]